LVIINQGKRVLIDFAVLPLYISTLMEGLLFDFAAETATGDIPLKMKHRISVMMVPENSFDRRFIKEPPQPYP